MGKRPPHKMPLSQRAKQFAPFDALKGFNSAIKDMESKTDEVEKITLSEDQLQQLDEILVSLKKGNEVTVRYYRNRRYVNIKGFFDRYDEYDRTIIISNQKLKMDDIAEIRVSTS